MNTIDNVLNEITQGAENIAMIDSQLFEVTKLPLQAPLMEIAENDEAPKVVIFEAPKDIYGVYKTTGGLPLGVMGKDFLPTQPKEILDAILLTLHESGLGVNANSISFNQYAGGSKIEFAVKSEPLQFKNARKLKDITEMEITFSTSYDGSKSNKIQVFTRRLVCLNGMTARGLEADMKGKNTVGGKAKIFTYIQELSTVLAGMKDWREKMIALDKVKVDTATIEKFKLELLGYNQATILADDKPNHAKKAILKSLDEAIEIEFKRTGETAFGLLQGVTYYTNHLANSSKTISDDEYIRFFQGAKTNDKAQELVFAMLN